MSVDFNEFIITSLNYNFSLKSNLKIIIVDSSFHLEFILKVFPQCLERVALIYLRYLACKNKVYKKRQEGKYENQKLFFCSFCNKHYIFYLFVVVEHEEYKTTNILTRHNSFLNIGQQQQKLQEEVNLVKVVKSFMDEFKIKSILQISKIFVR